MWVLGCESAMVMVLSGTPAPTTYMPSAPIAASGEDEHRRGILLTLNLRMRWQKVRILKPCCYSILKIRQSPLGNRHVWEASASSSNTKYRIVTKVCKNSKYRIVTKAMVTRSFSLRYWIQPYRQSQCCTVVEVILTVWLSLFNAKWLNVSEL